MKTLCNVPWFVRLGAVFFLAWTGSAAEFFVASTGKDDHPGTRAQPFATLVRAQQKARELAGKVPVIVTVLGGVYYLPDTLIFSPEDSGARGMEVVYQAASDEDVILSGGVRLELQWKPQTNGIWMARFTEENARKFAGGIDQLFLNGRRLPMARYPNYDSSQRIYNGFSSDAFSPERAVRWARPEGAYIHAMHRSMWGGYHYRITGKNAENVVSYEGGWQNNRQMGMHREYRYVENIAEELDAPGEWYFENGSGTLFLLPPAETSLSDAMVEVVRLKHLVEFRGGTNRPVRFVTLRGFTFRHSARTFMETREPLLRSDWTIYRGGSVVLANTEDCSITDSTFDQVGGNSIFVSGYNRRVAIRGCLIRDGGGNGIAFVGNPGAVRNPLFEYNQRQRYDTIDRTPGPRTEEFPADCLVEDCLITRIGRVEKQAAGVQISMSRRITVRHCSIYEVPRAGINIGDGTWGGHVIEGCDVFDTVLETGDHGSFNSWGRDRFWKLDGAPSAELSKLAQLDAVEPVILRNNRWRCDHGWDIDLDDGSSHYEIYNNLMLRGGLKLREGFQRKVWNNVTVNNSLHPHVWYPDSGDIVTQNIFMGAMRPAAMNPLLQKWGAEVDRNLYTTGDADRRKFTAKGCDTNSLAGDPLFVNPAQGDFQVREGSPALTLGFQNFEMNRFGVRKPQLRAIARTPVIPPIVIGTDNPEGPLATIVWRGATLRRMAGEEFSAVGVASDTPGVIVSDSPRGSAAARIGLQYNDFIQSVNGRPVATTDDFLKAVTSTSKDAALTLQIIRNQRQEMIAVDNTDSESPRAD